MSNETLELIKAYANDVVEANAAVSKNTLQSCYLEQLSKSGVIEPEIVSNKWIDYFWKRLSPLSKNQLAQALKTENTLKELSYTLFGK